MCSSTDASVHEDFPPLAASSAEQASIGVEHGLSHVLAAMHLAVSLEFREDRTW